MTEFTPWSAVAGGLLLGMGASIMLVFLGRITGISGIVGRIVDAMTNATTNTNTTKPASLLKRVGAWRFAFVAGLLVALPLAGAVSDVEVSTPTVGWLGLVVSGLLVGVGTRLGSGCTSGHGVCGIARLSVRSMVATVTFMGVAAVTVFVMRHVVGA